MDRLNNFDDDLINDLYNEIKKHEHKIKYDLSFNKPNNFKPKTISFDEINNYDFTKGFNEFLISEDYVHLYFDFDSIKNEDEFIDVYGWLESLKEIFGDFSYGGYTDNQEIADNYGFRFYPEGKHFLSIHVVFYETKISTKDLVEIMKHTQKKGFAMEGVHKLCDPNVYKLVSKRENQTTRQVFRHVLSDKIFKPNDPQNKQNHGFICENKTPDTQIIQVRGNERLITKDEWQKLFYLKQTKKELKQMRKEMRKQNFDIDDIEFEDKLIKMSEEELLEFLSYFDSSFNVLLNDLAPLYHSPFNKEFLTSILIKWYSKTEHQHDVEVSVLSILDRYYVKEKTNKWFYSLVRKLPEDVKHKYLNEFGNDSIDFTININNSKWHYEEVRRKTYEKHEFSKLINNIRGIIGFVKSRFYIKEIKEDQTYIRETSLTKIREELSLYKPFKSNTKITLYHIVSKYSNWFAYDDAKIMAVNEDEENIINIFQGFKYEESNSNDFSLLQPFLNHIKHIVCRDDEEKYEYFMKWWANIFQNITVKNGTMPIIHGAQGSGKSFPVECFCELLGNFALKNVDDLDKVFGKFNGLIGRHLLININEPPEATEKFKYLGKIKSKLTQKKTVQETKGIDQIEIDSWANYSMTTNNPNPVQEEKGDRRIIYYEANNEKCGDKEYFDNLCKPIQPIKQGPYVREYMELLLHYMRTQINVKDFDAETLIRKINNNTNVEFNEQLERQYLDLNAVDRFIVDNHELFKYGIALDDIKVDGYKSTGLARKLMSVCDVKRMRRTQYEKLMRDHNEIYGNRFCTQNQLRIYTLKPREQIPDLYAIIEYKAFNNNVNVDFDDEIDEDDIPVKQTVEHDEKI